MTQNSQESSDSGLANLLNFEASRRQALAIGGMSLGALLLAACSGGSSGNTSPTQPAGKPKKGGTLRASISDGSDGDTLDPGLVVSTNSFLACYPIYDQLAVLDDNFQAQPALAKSWTVNTDATRWTIHLREGVKWHDGTDFTSKDVVYTISRWLDPKTGSQFNAAAAPYLDMSGVKAPDASTVVLNLKKPNSILMQSVANAPYTMIVKDGVKDFTKNAIGTGPFKLAAWTPGASWKVVRNDAHWGGAPYLDGIAGTVTPDQGAKLQAALSGSTDVTDLIPTSLWPGLQGRNNVVLDTMKNRNCWVFAFDERKAPFNDQRVLDALKLATDRNKIVQTAVLGHGTAIADVPIDPTSSWYPTGLVPEFNVAKAKSLLADAGYPNGLDIKLSVTASVPGMLDVAQAWQQVVKDAGINVTLNQFPGETYWTKAWLVEPAYMDYWLRAFPPIYFDYFYRKDAAFPETHFDDPTLNKLVLELLSTTDQSQQVALTEQAYEGARKSFSYVIPAFVDGAIARSSKVNGMTWYVGLPDFRKAWLA